MPTSSQIFEKCILSASAVDDALVIRLGLEVGDPEERYRRLTMIQLTRPGGGRDSGALRNYLAEGTASDSYVTVTIPDYVSVSGLELQEY